MTFFERLFGRRASVEDPRHSPSNSELLRWATGVVGAGRAAGVDVTVEAALGVPAIGAAVNFLSTTIARLPLHVFERPDEGSPTRVRGRLDRLLARAANPSTTAYVWRREMMRSVLTWGRGCSYIERDPGTSEPRNLWPLQVTGLSIEGAGAAAVYVYRDGARTVRYAADEVIDITFALHEDGRRARSPIFSNAEDVGLAIAATRYVSRHFDGGGVPPFTISGPFTTPGGMDRAAEQLLEAVRNAASERRPALALPPGHEIKPIGADPKAGQTEELRRFQILQAARMYQLPPVFLQDLERATFANAEQQDLHLVKHTLGAWITQIELELGLKLFGRDEAARYVKFNLDGLLRGDFVARMDGYSKAIQHGVLTPNEARGMEDRPDRPEGGDLLVQGAMIPLASAGQGGGDAGGENGD